MSASADAQPPRSLPTRQALSKLQMDINYKQPGYARAQTAAPGSCARAVARCLEWPRPPAAARHKQLRLARGPKPPPCGIRGRHLGRGRGLGRSHCDAVGDFGCNGRPGWRGVRASDSGGMGCSCVVGASGRASSKAGLRAFSSAAAATVGQPPPWDPAAGRSTHASNGSSNPHDPPTTTLCICALVELQLTFLLGVEVKWLCL